MILWTAGRYQLAKRVGDGGRDRYLIEDDEYAEEVTPEELVELAAVIRRELRAG